MVRLHPTAASYHRTPDSYASRANLAASHLVRIVRGESSDGELDLTERVIWQGYPAISARVGRLVAQWLNHQERPGTFTVQSFLHLSDRLQTEKGIKQTIYSDNGSSSSRHSYSALPRRDSLVQQHTAYSLHQNITQHHLPIPSGTNAHSGRNRLAVAESKCPVPTPSPQHSGNTEQ